MSTRPLLKWIVFYVLLYFIYFLRHIIKSQETDYFRPNTFFKKPVVVAVRLTNESGTVAPPGGAAVVAAAAGNILAEFEPEDPLLSQNLHLEIRVPFIYICLKYWAASVAQLVERPSKVSAWCIPTDVSSNPIHGIGVIKKS